VPVAVDPNGQVIDLPPLPEAVASADLNRIPPEPAQPSGQAAHVVSEPIRDDRIARIRFEPLEQAEARPASGTASGAATTVTRLESRFVPVESAEARCSVGPAKVPTATIPALVAQLVQKLCEMDEDLQGDLDDSTRALVGRYFTGKCVSTEEETPPCTMPDCKSCGATASKRSNDMSVIVSLKDPAGKRVVDATSRLESALKTPGKTETQYIPLGGKFALEIKATLVPAVPGLYKEIQKIDTTPANP
jgi:hypothetical protein